MPPKPVVTAYITGAASGIGAAVAHALHARGIRLALADSDLSAAQTLAATLNATSSFSFQTSPAIALEVDVADWDSQATAFFRAVAELGRIDIVIANAGIGERVFVPNDGGKGTAGFVKPDLDVLDVDLKGCVFTVALGIQQMRRQGVGGDGWRGRIVATASVCGFYCVPTLPVYTAAKHGVVGFVRSYGKYLPEEKTTLNAVCPHVVRTSISTTAYYDTVAKQGLLTPMERVVEAFERFIDADTSGECLEVGPGGDAQLREPASVLNEESAKLNELLYYRGHPLHEPR